jgi:YidC/Oxa1 family membrane protein insertase
MFDTYLVQPLFNLLAGIYGVLPLHDLGLAIIIMTILVRLALWPLINKQLHSQKAIQELQPEMARIKKEAKGDKQLESKLVMELYKEKEISPLASMWPLLIQLPIFIALFVVLKDIVKPGEIAHLVYEPLRHLGILADIIAGKVKLDLNFIGFINLANPSPVLAVMAGVAQFFQTKQIQPKQQANDSQAKTMATMTYLFPAVTFFIGLSLPAALALYWTVTSLLAIFQQYLVLQRDVREVEAAPVKKGGKK